MHGSESWGGFLFKLAGAAMTKLNANKCVCVCVSGGGEA